tara:strand:+ start:88 stop:1335 length:1248 start_codon:yes stop_codon:yes gene_type:complete
MDIGEVKYWKHPSETNCVFINNRNSPLISIDIWCKAGISFEEKDKGGIAHFLEHMIFKGCNKLLPGEFDLKIESLGGSSNASTGYDDAHYYVLTPSANFKESLTLLSNLVLNPNLNSKEFNQEKSVVIEEIMQYYDQPDERIFSIFLKEVWIDHFYSKPILGKEELVKSISIEELRAFHSRQYVKENICLAISGNLPTNALEIFENCNLPFSETHNFNNTNIIPTYKSSIRNGKKIIKLKNIEFSRIFKAWQIPENKDQKLLLAFEMVASILCDGHNGKLIKPLKEENNLVESIYADVHSGEFGNLFIIETCCVKKNLSIVEVILDKTLEELFLKRNVSKNEVKRASRMINSNYIFNLETASQLTSYFGNNLLWDRLNPHIKLKENIEHWSNIQNFEEIFEYFTNDEFTLIVEKI